MFIITHNYHELITAKVLLRRQMMGHLMVAHLNYLTVKKNELSNQTRCRGISNALLRKKLL